MLIPGWQAMRYDLELWASVGSQREKPLVGPRWSPPLLGDAAILLAWPGHGIPVGTTSTSAWVLVFPLPAASPPSLNPLPTRAAQFSNCHWFCRFEGSPWACRRMDRESRGWQCSLGAVTHHLSPREHPLYFWGFSFLNCKTIRLKWKFPPSLNLQWFSPQACGLLSDTYWAGCWFL